MHAISTTKLQSFPKCISKNVDRTDSYGQYNLLFLPRLIIISNLDGAHKIADSNHLQEYLDLLEKIFKGHGYRSNEIHRVIKKSQDKTAGKDEEEIIGVAVIPSVVWSQTALHIF